MKYKYLTDLSENEIESILSDFNKITTKEISYKYKISPASLYKLLDFKSINYTIDEKKYLLLRQTPFNKIQKNLITGLLLGSAYLEKNDKNIKRLCLSSKNINEIYYYLFFLDPFVNNFNFIENNYLLKTNYHKDLAHFENLNKIPINFDMILSDFTLATWYFDCGYLKNNISININTSKYSYEDNIKIQSTLLSVFDLKCKIAERTYKNSKYNYLSFNKDNTLKFVKIISPFKNTIFEKKFIK